MPATSSTATGRIDAFRAFRVLVRARMSMLRNAYRTATGTHKLLIGTLVLFGVAIFAGIGIACAALVLIMQSGLPHGAPLTPPAQALVSHVYQYLFFFLLTGSVPYVASSLFQDNDLPMLLTSPAPSSSVIGAKMVDAVVSNSSHFTVLGVPVLIGLWWGVGLGPSGWAWCAAGLFLLLILTPLLTGFLLLILAKLFGMRRVRFVVMTVSIVMAVSITLLAMMGASKATQGGSMDYHRMRAVLLENSTSRSTDIKSALVQSLHGIAPSTPKLSVSTGGAIYLPSTWAAAVALDASGRRQVGRVGFEGLGLLAVGSVALFVLCLLVGRRVLVSETILEQQDLDQLAQHRRSRRLALPGVSQRIAAMVLKDARYVGRDTILLGQIGTTLILFIVPFVLRATQPSDPSYDMYGDLMKLMIALIVFMMTSIIGLSTVALEGRGVWMVLGSPLARRDFLRAKWILSFVLSFGIVVVLTSIAGITFGWTPGEVLQWMGILGCACYALTGLSVGLGGLFPRFLYDNPAHRASIWAMVLGFVVGTTYVAVSASMFLIAWRAFGDGLSIANGVALTGVAVFVIVTMATGMVPVKLAERRLIAYEWES